MPRWQKAGRLSAGQWLLGRPAGWVPAHLPTCLRRVVAACAASPTFAFLPHRLCCPPSQVELLFKSMNMQLQDVAPSNLLAGRRRESLDNIDFQVRTPACAAHCSQALASALLGCNTRNVHNACASADSGCSCRHELSIVWHGSCQLALPWLKDCSCLRSCAGSAPHQPGRHGGRPRGVRPRRHALQGRASCGSRGSSRGQAGAAGARWAAGHRVLDTFVGGPSKRIAFVAVPPACLLFKPCRWCSRFT